MLFLQPFADYRTDNRGAPQAAACQNLEADFAGCIGHQFYTYVMGMYGGAVFTAATHGKSR